MAQKGKDKQVPLDQRARGMNDEHKEGQANIQNQKQQGAAAPQPKQGKEGGNG